MFPCFGWASCFQFRAFDGVMFCSQAEGWKLCSPRESNFWSFSMGSSYIWCFISVLCVTLRRRIDWHEKHSRRKAKCSRNAMKYIFIHHHPAWYFSTFCLLFLPCWEMMHQTNWMCFWRACVTTFRVLRLKLPHKAQQQFWNSLANRIN